MEDIQDTEWLADEMRELFRFVSQHQIPKHITDQMIESLMFDATVSLHGLVNYATAALTVSESDTTF